MILDLKDLPKVYGIVVVGNSTIVTFEDKSKSSGVSDYALEVVVDYSSNNRLIISAKLGSVYLTNSSEVLDYVNKLKRDHEVYDTNTSDVVDIRRSGFNLT